MELWWPVTLPCCFAAFWVWREKIDLEDSSSFVPGCLGSRLRGGGGDTQATRARKQKETLLLAGLRELLQGICSLSGDDDDLRTSGNNAAQCNAAQGNAVQRKLAQPSKAKRRKAKRQAQEGGLIGGLRRVLERASSEKDLIPKLYALLLAAERGKLHEGRLDGMSSVKQVAPQPKAKAKGVAKAKAKPFAMSVEPSPTPVVAVRKGPWPFIPVALVAARWFGVVVSPAAAVSKAYETKAGEHFVVGVLPNGVGTLDQVELPEGATLTLVAAVPFKDAILLRAPASDSKGNPKVVYLYYWQKGVVKPPLRWTSVGAGPLPAPKPTGVVRIC